jgi:gamma-glutamyltranspeptidase/glutathione hydrolase
MRLLLFTLLILPPLVSGCGQRDLPEIISGKDINVRNAMVVSAHPEASRIGAGVMAAGGNAVDAAVAVEYALAVCYPTAGNIGGGGFMVVRLADGTTDAIDYREKAPSAAHRDMYLDSTGNVIEGLSLDTHLSAGVPGTVDGTLYAHSLYGKLSLEKIIQPAIDLAVNGFPLTASQAASLNGMRETFTQRNDHPVAFVRDLPWREGDTLRQPELGETLKRIRDNGREGFYEGETAGMIISGCAGGNGIITAADLREYRSVSRDPIETDYLGYKIISMPPPSSGGILLAQLLTMTEMTSRETDSFMKPSTMHLMAEAERRAFADRAHFLGDPDFTDISVEGLLNRKYLLQRTADIDPGRATPSSSVTHGTVTFSESEETTHYSVVDAMGNAVAGTTTLNNSYGTAIVVRGAGFILNDQMDDFSVKPGFPNLYGLIGGEANAIAPGKRMLSSMTPTIIEKEGSLFMVVGSPGGSTIITTVFQVIRNVVDFGMGIYDAVAAPRFHHQWIPDVISYEAGTLDSLVITELQRMGHQLTPRGTIGRADAILIGADGRRYAGADPRGDDTAAGW